eukprot:scaffold22592_cov129-Cylindrotheca_fusiformis.AAC.21
MTPSQEKPNQLMEETLAEDMSHFGDCSENKGRESGVKEDGDYASETRKSARSVGENSSLTRKAIVINEAEGKNPETCKEDPLEKNGSNLPPRNKSLDSMEGKDSKVCSSEVDEHLETTSSNAEAEPSNPVHGTVKKELADESNLCLETGKLQDTEVQNATRSNDVSGPPKVIHAEIQNLSTPLRLSSNGSPTQSTSISPLPKTKGLRRGKWTVEEEAYVARVIQDFNSGYLNAPAGTTLRSYLSEKLQCDPMRITKKFTGDACIGKRVFHPAVRSAGNTSSIDKAQAELDALERRWRRRLEMQQRESAKKAAASAAAVNHAPHDSVHHIQGVPVGLLDSQAPQGAVGNKMQQNVVTQAASWLDRANAILAGASKGDKGVFVPAESSLRESHQFDSTSSNENEIESQMQEVRRLIYEGPIIQQTAAGLPHLLSYDTRENTIATVNRVPMAGEHSKAVEPADKRQRRTSVSGAEDAEALVGFLRSVRASATSSQDVAN